MIFQRLLKTRDIEFYRVIQNDNIEDVFGYLLIYDKRGPAKIDDFTVFARSNIDKEAFAVNIKKNHIHTMFFHFTDLEEESEIPKFTKVIRFIEGLLSFQPETSHYVDNYLIDKKLKFEYPAEFEKIGEFARYLVEVSGRKIVIPDTSREKYLYLTQ
ncbi:hypothetical protein HCJ52_00910 [Listeria sp. FSL L7-1485]|uniref:Uncharacterized protein n=1 Tax=Listeria immobilis TaxID=2713502 RepID=A0A7X0X4V7_9LIST|nr:hypothetical protein [Listeria immobilis]MBC1481879.1 hypothetical protein [Listeria immobilis]MBC1487555.1 hypothetical protein [Listeria immobilis]MBC1506863.1 hypothetical protein [Listeria immobilis]MBC1509618.1 hypothetical protein [Listeria immobilis]MBC1515362.1 hypothetical protein [Listeria immobilis]